MNYFAHAAGAANAYQAFSQSLAEGPLDLGLRELVNLRVSQINGCGFCADLHVKTARQAGERELRLHHVAVWRESPLFDDRERAALEWAEAVTRLSHEGIPDALYDRVRQVLGEDLLAELSFAVVEINGWNRLGVAFRPAPGSMDQVLGVAGSGLT
jgi:AhpD family alkylhydroperoxidase